MPATHRLTIVTASTDTRRAADCIDSWYQHAQQKPRTLIVENGTPSVPYLGTVPAFRRGVDQLLEETDAEIIACLHDDFQISEDGWDEKVLKYFDRHPAMGLAGFGGAVGLGDADIYQKDYAPMQLARIGFRSDLIDAESHGMRSLLAEKVACLDGFSQIGRRAFWLGGQWTTIGGGMAIAPADLEDERSRPWTVLQDLGFRHHFYDGALGCLATRYGWETWYLPLRGRHFGGQTAVGDQGYQDWAKQFGGDHGLWEQAHAIGYEAFRDVLPLRV